MPKIALAQMISSASVIDNLSEVETFFRQAKEMQVDLLVLPENFAFMGREESDKFPIAEKYLFGEIQTTISLFAKRYDLWVIAGTLPLQGSNNRVRASCLVFDNKGKSVARYDKIHLFDVQVSEKEKYEESATVERGNDLVVVETPVGKVGLTVCYDLRFPELYQQLVRLGAELLSIPSAFTAITGAAHWESLLRARAIENLAYVIAPNQGGLHDNGRHTYGHSMIIDPWGKILADCGTKTGLVSAEINLQELRHLRKKFPTNEHHVLIN